MYGDGHAEEVLGRALQEVAVDFPRSSYYIFTKISEAFLDPSMIERHLDASLARLQTSYVDLYQIHWHSRAAVKSATYPERALDQEVELSATLNELERLRKTGKIRHIGVCNFGPRDTIACLNSTVPVVSNQLCYNLAWRGIEATVLPLCLSPLPSKEADVRNAATMRSAKQQSDPASNNVSAKKGMGILAWSPLLQGILTGKFASADDVPSGRARTRLFSNAGSTTRKFGRHGESGHEDSLFRTLKALRVIADTEHASLATLALAWVMSRQGVSSVLMGARSPDQVTRNLQCLDYVERFDAGNAAAVRVLAKLTAATESLLLEVGTENLDPYESTATSRMQ